MHHGTCVTHVPWCKPGSLTNGFLWSRWRRQDFCHWKIISEMTTYMYQCSDLHWGRFHRSIPSLNVFTCQNSNQNAEWILYQGPLVTRWWNLLWDLSISCWKSDVDPSNSLRANFFRGNINIYLHFMWCLDIEMSQVVEILPRIRPGLNYLHGQ